MKCLSNTKQFILITFVSILGAVSVSCNAKINQNPRISSSLNIHDCSQSSTQLVMDACREEAYKKIFEKLTLVTKKIYESYGINEPKLKPIFKVAQQEWSEFINAECEFSSYYSRGGAGYNGYFLGCLELKTLKRIQYLENVLETP